MDATCAMRAGTRLSPDGGSDTRIAFGRVAPARDGRQRQLGELYRGALRDRLRQRVVRMRKGRLACLRGRAARLSDCLYVSRRDRAGHGTPELALLECFDPQTEAERAAFAVGGPLAVLAMRPRAQHAQRQRAVRRMT